MKLGYGTSMVWGLFHGSYEVCLPVKPYWLFDNTRHGFFLNHEFSRVETGVDERGVPSSTEVECEG